MSSVFRFNLGRPAFKGTGQKPLRKAIKYALDRPALARACGYLECRASDRLVPAALRESLDPVSGPDLVTARRWAARAKNRPPMTLTLYMPTYPWSLAVAEELEANLKRLGIDLEVEYFEFYLFLQKLNNPGAWDLAWSPR